MPGDCLPTVWPTVVTLALVAGFTLFLIGWGVAPWAAITAVSSIGAAANLVVRRSRLRAAWAAVGVLAGTAVVAVLLITWGFAPAVAVATTSGIAAVATAISRSLLNQQRVVRA